MIEIKKASIIRTIYQELYDGCVITIGEFDAKGVNFWGIYLHFSSIDGEIGHLYSYDNRDFSKLIYSLNAIKKNNYAGKIVFPFGPMNLKLSFKGLDISSSIKVRSYLSASIIYFSGFIFAGMISLKHFDELISALLTVRDNIKEDNINIEKDQTPDTFLQSDPHPVMIFFFVFFLFLLLIEFLYP